jgi:hypothetical protein
MYKTHTYDDPEKKPSMYEELEENEVFTPGYDEGVFKQVKSVRNVPNGGDDNKGKVINVHERELVIVNQKTIEKQGVLNDIVEKGPDDQSKKDIAKI